MSIKCAVPLIISIAFSKFTAKSNQKVKICFFIFESLSPKGITKFNSCQELNHKDSSKLEKYIQYFSTSLLNQLIFA